VDELRKWKVGLFGTTLGAIAIAGSITGAAALRDEPAPGDVTAQEATLTLDRAIAIVEAGRQDALCREIGAGESYCTISLHDVGCALRTPTERPTIVASRPVPHQFDVPDGWVLTVEGLDGVGEKYRTDFYVVRDGNGKLKSPYPVYWRTMILRDHGGK
jgi:hypothetical protein